MTLVTIDNADELWRSVRVGEFDTKNGKLVFSASAFNDRDRKPSIDCSSLRPDPFDSRKSDEDGIAKLIAGEVRAKSKIPIFDNKGNSTGDYHAADIISRPIKNNPLDDDNPAHCQIECQPAIENDNRFKRLKESLAIQATQYGFIVEPGQARPT